VLLKERPIAARSVLGLLNYKPQFGALIRSYWREWGAGVQWLAWRLISICRADIARAYRGGRVHGCSSCHPLESRPRPYISGASHRALGHLRHGPWVQDLQSNGSGNTVVYFIPAIARAMAHYAFAALGVPAITFCLALIYGRMHIALRTGSGLVRIENVLTRCSSCRERQKQTAW
jgi:hypothetical protein